MYTVVFNVTCVLALNFISFIQHASVKESTNATLIQEEEQYSKTENKEKETSNLVVDSVITSEVSLKGHENNDKVEKQLTPVSSCSVPTSDFSLTSTALSQDCKAAPRSGLKELALADQEFDIKTIHASCEVALEPQKADTHESTVRAGIQPLQQMMTKSKKPSGLEINKRGRSPSFDGTEAERGEETFRKKCKLDDAIADSPKGMSHQGQESKLGVVQTF